MSRLLLVGLVALAGCSGAPEQTELQWLEGAGFGWRLFNHRVSHVELRLDDDRVDAAILGGTSTTGLIPDLDGSCDSATCKEFPFFDEADLQVAWARALAPDVAVGRGIASLMVGPEGASGRVVVELSGEAREQTVAILDGLRLDTDHPLLGGASCYWPKYGWLPRRLAVALGEPEVREGAVEVPISAAFRAGLTLEEDRECLDAVIDQAQVEIELEVLVVSGPGEARAHEVGQEATFPYGTRGSPELQEPPAPEPLAVEVGEALVGFSAVDFAFHVDDPEGRGAYLRTLVFNAAHGQVEGNATNYSPGTQLSGFDFQFDGVVRTLELGAAVERGTVVERIPAELDEGGQPVLHALPL